MAKISKTRSKRIFEKEPFKPNETHLGMKLIEARMEVKKKQREIAVAIEKSLPKDINIINNALIYKDQNLNQIKNLPIETQEILNSINKISKNIEILLRSKAARILAVHRVISNTGYRSPGVTKKFHPRTNEEYVKLVEWLKYTISHPNKYQTSPLDRIYLLKTNKTNKFPKVEKPNIILGDTYSKEKYLRPISIPSIKDRCLQSLYYIGYAVYSEYVADSNSYAFRPGRSPAWAAHSLAITLRSTGAPTWAVEIDIAKCFDNIEHKFIIKYTPFIPKMILSKWLKQGYILRKHESLGVFETNSGIPQGGIISPTICNTVLDGAENFIRKALWEEYDKKLWSHKDAGYSYFRGKKNESLFKLFRFADDIVITTKSKLIAEKSKYYLSVFLKERGLQLSIEKTKLTDISGYNAYFEFIGYAFVKRYIKAENKSKWFIDMPDNNIRRIKTRLRTLCKEKSSVENLFYDFSLILRSWVAYYASMNISKNLQLLNLWVYKTFYYALSRRIKLSKELRRKQYKKKRKQKKKIGKITDKYIYNIIHKKFIKVISYHKTSKMKWYTIKMGKGNRRKSFRLFSPRIFRIIKQNITLTTQNLNYFNINDIKSIERINLNHKFGTRRTVLYKNFNKYGVLTCPCCYEPFHIVGKYEFHHILPVEFGGDNKTSNLIPLCIPCHKDISILVNKRSSDISEYIFRDLVKIPEEDLEKFD